MQSQIDTTRAQISAFGKLKAAVSEAQLGTRALSSLPQGGSAAEAKTAAQRFVDGFSAAASAARSTDAGTGKVCALGPVAAASHSSHRRLAPHRHQAAARSQPAFDTP